MLPQEWSSILSGPSFLLGCERYSFRREHSLALVQSAGFSGCSIVEGWDGYVNPKATDRALEDLGIRMDTYLTLGHKGCSLSHFLLWKRIVDEQIPFATIFEDDVIPHPEVGGTLGESYWSETPKHHNLVLLGSMMPWQLCLGEYSEKKVVSHPAYCLHAYVLTYEGARQLLAYAHHLTLTRGSIPMNDIFVVYMMAQKEISYSCWNGTMIPKPYPTYDPMLPWQFFPNVILAEKDTGLFYQNYRCGTTIAKPFLDMEIPKYHD
jgi:Glycosyltransferase family 25 (LPS biosynthesis protein)